MDKKMHVAMLIGSLTRGGAEHVMVNLADDFVKRGHQVTLVTQYEKENEYPLHPAVKRMLSDITEEETGRSRILNFVKRFRKLRRIWKEEKPDVILSFIGKNNMMAILTSRFLQIPVAVSVRAEPSLEYYNSWMRFMARHLFARADGVILQTRACFAFFPQKVQKRGVILKNPVSSAFFRSRYEGEREKTIVAVGRVDENKDHEMLIRAFAELAKEAETSADTGFREELQEYRLIIYGDGDCRERLIRLAGELGLADRISLPGSIENVADAIYRARIFVLCSRTEGVPNTLIEAMLMGLTVVATDCPCGGPADLIEHGVNGLLTPVGDVKKMKENLQMLLKNMQKADDMGKNAGKLAETFSPELVYGSWERYLLSLVK